jgi:purine-binding chemotaxis protein CheW
MEYNWEKLEEQILKDRALALSRLTREQDAPKERKVLLAFLLMGAHYSIPLEKVEAVTRIGDIISIPLTPRHMTGIIRLRGRTFTLVSLRHFFHPEDESLKDADFAIIANAGDKRFAIQAEEIEGVFEIAKEKMVPPPENYDPAQTGFISGVTIEGLSVLDLDALVEAKGFGMSGSVL